MQNARRIETARSGNGWSVCGIRPEPNEQPVELNRNYHPGFGGLTLFKNGEQVYDFNPPSESQILEWIDSHILDNEAIWELRIDGPFISYILVRREPKTWVLLAVEDGFA